MNQQEMVGAPYAMTTKPDEQVRDFIVRFTLAHQWIESMFRPNDVVPNYIFLQAMHMQLHIHDSTTHN